MTEISLCPHLQIAFLVLILVVLQGWEWCFDTFLQQMDKKV